MEIIAGLETRPRGVYTGAIGYLEPDGRMQFSVAIRTAVVDERQHTLDFGVGSGIVWDSVADREYDECLVKGSILRRTPSFQLLETMKWTPEEDVVLFERHLTRLERSAAYFGFICDPSRIRTEVGAATADATGPLRLRVLLRSDGDVQVDRYPFEPQTRAWRVRLAATPIDPSDPLLYHKTTDRRLYDERCLPDCDDVLLWNRAREVTESTIANLVVDLDGRRVTPPVSSGLLPGTFRAELLETGQVVESIVTIDALRRARRVWLVNSVRGWWEAEVM
jgi:para-aminobenzoate synthetase/4-amino-4-deoxychorismate lyase